MQVGQSQEKVFPLSDRDVDRPVLILGIDYPDGYVAEPHRHRRAQFLYGSSGVVLVSTSDGSWIMPPQRGLWIPAGTEHSVRMLGSVAMCSLYIDEAAFPGGFQRCEVVGVSDLLRSLLMAAPGIALEYNPDGRDGALVNLLLHELRELAPLPLSLPFPRHPRLAVKCREFLERPSPHDSIDTWSDELGMTRRTFTRLFKRETGCSFVEWRQKACLISALPQLADGHSVTSIALNLGYENPASFTSMFKRLLGSAPTEYRSQR
ncbi:AraC family transcriptional regulator [Rhizobium panacihumi]|uniref:AraC family transcriptional regulator n=1 Tax=Rhizobium panacihumi TaxID=2008450 RepID=UPI003D7B201E